MAKYEHPCPEVQANLRALGAFRPADAGDVRRESMTQRALLWALSGAYFDSFEMQAQSDNNREEPFVVFIIAFERGNYCRIKTGRDLLDLIYNAAMATRHQTRRQGQSSTLAKDSPVAPDLRAGEEKDSN